MTLFEYDKAYREKHGIEYLAGVDEAGRGPLAGPVFAAAVILPPDFEIEGINDSKKLSEKKREALYDIIVENALCYAVCTAEVPMIEEINILNATLFAMRSTAEKLSYTPQRILIDGNRAPKDLILPHETLVKGDGTSQSVAAASILAKVTRDRFCKEVLEKNYPEYEFAKHKGYGTKLHFEKIVEFGPCPEHRLSFLRKKLGDL